MSTAYFALLIVDIYYYLAYSNINIIKSQLITSTISLIYIAIKIISKNNIISKETNSGMIKFNLIS